MIVEHAVLSIRPGEESDFEAAFREARPLVSATPGFRRLALRRSLESPNLYLMLIEWETLEAHTEGFRGSAHFEQWRALLHHFYEPFPTVEHYVDVLGDPETGLGE